MTNNKNQPNSKELAEAAHYYATVIEILHRRFKPHPNQLPIGRAVFNDRKNQVFLQCGRQFGKTALAVYMTVRYAALNPDSRVFYFCPEQKQVRDTYFDKLVTFLRDMPELIKVINKQQMTVEFINGAKIIADGTDNLDARRGITAHFIVMDELKDFNPAWWDEVGEPSTNSTEGISLFIGTPPKRNSKNRDGYLEIQRLCRTDPDYCWFKYSSYDNPYNDQRKLNKKRAKYERRGEMHIWDCEYMAEIVDVAEGAVFPMFSDALHTASNEQLMEIIRRDKRKLDWYCIQDPATSSTFAVMIVALNPYTKTVYVLDEIYESRAHFNSASIMWQNIKEKMLFWNDDIDPEDMEWVKIYDEAAQWYANEIAVNYGVGMMATDKKHNKKDEGLSLIKDQLIKKRVYINKDNCPNLLFEVKAYSVDETGKIPKKNDHLIDCWRYFNAACNYSFLQMAEEIDERDPMAKMLMQRRKDREDAENLGTFQIADYDIPQ